MRHISEYLRETLHGSEGPEGSPQRRGSDYIRLTGCWKIDVVDLGSELAAELYVDEVLDGSGRFQYLDRVSSVSALPEAGTEFDS